MSEGSLIHQNVLHYRQVISSASLISRYMQTMADEKCLKNKQIQAHILNIYIPVNRNSIWATYFIYLFLVVRVAIC